jgi:hypothetical protein
MKGGDVHRGTTLGNKSQQRQDNKKKNLLDTDRGCSGCCNMAGVQSGQVRDTGKRVSAREK